MISVVIRTKNSERTLSEVIQGLGCQTSDEVIVVDSGSTDRTLLLAEEAGAYVVHLEGEFNYSAALNRGFSAARMDWVLSLSSHCIPLRDPLLPRFRCAIADQDPSVAVVYGSVHLSAREKIDTFSGLITQTTFQKDRIVPGGNGIALYRRSIWEKRPFSTEVPTAEDVEWFLWALQAGFQALSLPEAAVLYRNQSSIRRMFEKGLMETRVFHALAGGRRAGPREIVLGFGTLVKKFAFGELPADATVRQFAHRLGAIYGSWLPPWNQSSL